MLKIYRLYRKPRFSEILLEKKEIEKGNTIPADTVIDIILKKFGFTPVQFWKYILTDVKIYVADPWYNPVTSQDIAIIENACRSVLKSYEYIQTIFDCDDFTCVMIGEVSKLRYRYMKNYAFGYCWILLNIDGRVYGHATCFYIDESLRFRWFEPQLCREIDFDRFDPKPVLIVI